MGSFCGFCEERIGDHILETLDNCIAKLTCDGGYEVSGTLTGGRLAVRKHPQSNPSRRNSGINHDIAHKPAVQTELWAVNYRCPTKQAQCM